MVLFMMCEEDVAYILKHPVVMVGSDAFRFPANSIPGFMEPSPVF